MTNIVKERPFFVILLLLHCVFLHKIIPLCENNNAHRTGIKFAPSRSVAEDLSSLFGMLSRVHR